MKTLNLVIKQHDKNMVDGIRFVAFVIAGVICGDCLAAELLGLGHLGAFGEHEVTSSGAYDISADGRVVVGRTTTPDGNRPFRWTRDTGMVAMEVGDLSLSSTAFGISPNGRYIVGMTQTAVGTEGFLWSQDDGMQILDFSDQGFRLTSINAVSDNAVVVGSLRDESDNIQKAYRWSQESGIQTLESADEGQPQQALDISSDGSVIVGAMDTSEGSRAFRWTDQADAVDLGTFVIRPIVTPQSVATSVSSDGQFIAGGSSKQVLLWTASEDRIFGLGDLGGESNGLGISDDGLVVVGEYEGQLERDRALIWTPETDLIDLNDHLSDIGVNMREWVLGSARAVSADGRVMVGWGAGPNGDEAWVAIVPESAAWMPATIAWLWLTTICRRRAVSGSRRRQLQESS